VTQVLSVYAIFTTLNIPAGSIYKVSGRAWILLCVIVPYLIVLFLSLLLFADRGILAVAICLTVCQGIVAVISVAIAGKILAVPYRRIGGVMAALGATRHGCRRSPDRRARESRGQHSSRRGYRMAVYTRLLWWLAPDIPSPAARQGDCATHGAPTIRNTGPDRWCQLAALKRAFTGRQRSAVDGRFARSPYQGTSACHARSRCARWPSATGRPNLMATSQVLREPPGLRRSIHPCR
jgi:hypothetical protein